MAMSNVRFPVPPGTPEAKAAIERVRQRLEEEERRTRPLILPGSRRAKAGPRTCPACGRLVRTRGQTHCWRHRGHTRKNWPRRDSMSGFCETGLRAIAGQAGADSGRPVDSQGVSPVVGRRETGDA